MTEKVESFIGIGSNVGDRVSFVRDAVAKVRDAAGIQVETVSSLYETSPLGGPPQRSYINLVAKLTTTLDPHALLEQCLSIEQQMGREESAIRWGPRVVDLDILTYDAEKISEPDLEIPHPRMTERRFVLVPLTEVAPELTDPWGTRYSDFVEDALGEVELLEVF